MIKEIEVLELCCGISRACVCHRCWLCLHGVSARRFSLWKWVEEDVDAREAQSSLLGCRRDGLFFYQVPTSGYLMGMYRYIRL